MVSREEWNKTKPDLNPFLSWEFFHALIKSKSASPDSGWDLRTAGREDTLLYWFEKTHSYGEFIFDWSWAEAYQRYGVDYYPKFTSMVPFSPVTTSHFLMKKFSAEKASLLLSVFQEEYKKSKVSSAHFLFLTDEEIPVFKNADYLIRESIQYHFFNQNYESFDSFLDTLKTKKAKTIRKERLFPDLHIRKFSNTELNDDHARRMYNYYISTIQHKQSYDYLNEDFFREIFRTLKENILFVEASDQMGPFAGALFFFDQEKLYGRYWGTLKDFQNLHFELCYYQGIDFVIQKKLKIFEAGAQGEHKILRGFRPVKVFSSHTFKNDLFHKAIGDFIEKEKTHTQNNIDYLSTLLPFKERT